MDDTVLSSSCKVSSIQAEVDAPHRARVGSQFLRHEQPGELLARLPVLAHPDPSSIARAGAVKAVVGGGAQAPRFPLLVLVPLFGAAAAVRDAASQLPDAAQPPSPRLPPGLGRGGGMIGGGRGSGGRRPLHELVHDRGAADAELELLEGELAAGAHLPDHLLVHLPDLELGAVVEVPDPALLPAAGAVVPRQRRLPEAPGSGLLRAGRRRGRGRRRRGRRTRLAARRGRLRRIGGEAEALEQEAAALLDGGGLGDPDVVRGGGRGRGRGLQVAVGAPAAAVVGVVVGGGGGGAGGGEDPIQRLVELLLLPRVLGRRIRARRARRRLRHCVAAPLGPDNRQTNHSRGAAQRGGAGRRRAGGKRRPPAQMASDLVTQKMASDFIWERVLLCCVCYVLRARGVVTSTTPAELVVEWKGEGEEDKPGPSRQ